MYRVRRIGVVKTATAVAGTFFIGAGILFVIGGLLFVPAWVRFGSLSGTGIGDGAQFVLPAAIVGTLLVLVVYSVFAWIAVAIFCVIYNFIGRHGGGIEIELGPVEPPAMVPTWGPPPPPPDVYGWGSVGASGPTPGWPGAPGPAQRTASPPPPPWGAPVPPPDTSPWTAPPNWRG